MNTETNSNAGSGCPAATCSLRALLPGNWLRPYKQAPHVWEDDKGNRVIIGYAINYLTLRWADGTPGGCYDHQKPFRSALKRNPNRRRAGLAAARRFFAARGG